MTNDAPKFELFFIYRDEITRAISLVADNEYGVWWRFEDNGVVTLVEGDGEVAFQMGMTLGGKGRVFLCAETDSDLISFRLTAGL